MDLFLEQPETAERATIDWRKVRQEYFKVWVDFPVIAKPFGIVLSDTQIEAIGQMLVSMDLIDSAIDAEPRQPRRMQFCESILKWMKHERDASSLAEVIDIDRMSRLRGILQDRDIKLPFLAAAAQVFRASERKRNATTVSELIRNLIDEGQSAAEMTIQILGANTNAGLNRFLRRIMRIGTIVDTLLDAADDFEQGILKIVPGRIFRLQLTFAIARQLPGLIWGFPDRALLWRYCLSYTQAELDLVELTPLTSGSGDPQF